MARVTQLLLSIYTKADGAVVASYILGKKITLMIGNWPLKQEGQIFLVYIPCCKFNRHLKAVQPNLATNTHFLGNGTSNQ